MNTNELAALGIGRASRWLQGARRAYEDGRWDDVVYNAEMAAEQALKAILIFFGIDYPKEHDVSDAILQLVEKEGIPVWFKEQLETMAESISELSDQRGLAGYGFEQGITAEYFKDYAPQALAKAENTFSNCDKLMKNLLKSRR